MQLVPATEINGLLQVSLQFVGLDTFTVEVHVPLEADKVTLVPTGILVTFLPEIVPAEVDTVAPVVSINANSQVVPPLHNPFPAVN